MPELKPTKTVYTIAQFINWQKSGILVLNPIFQRRHVWKPSAKSQFIDSIVRGYPIPIIFLRHVQNITNLTMSMEVVDGQQRLRTLISFLAPNILDDYSDKKDCFTVSKAHNISISGKPFIKLPDEIKKDILDYEISTHVFPASVGDDVVFRIFARLNSTGLRLNAQEIRNAEYHGYFKTLVYDLGFQYLELWRKWKLFSDDSIARMDEAEAVSEYLLLMLHGIAAKKQLNISKYYKLYENSFDNTDILRFRFERTIDQIDSAIGIELQKTSFSRPALFYTLFGVIYDYMYGIGSPLTKKAPKRLPSGIGDKLISLTNKIQDKLLPVKTQDAFERSTGDYIRRELRHEFLKKELGFELI